MQEFGREVCAVWPVARRAIPEPKPYGVAGYILCFHHVEIHTSLAALEGKCPMYEPVRISTTILYSPWHNIPKAMSPSLPMLRDLYARAYVWTYIR